MIKKVFILGASSDIGVETTKLFLNKGWDCNIWCLSKTLKKILNTMPSNPNKEKIKCLN